jgi:hypothetical protein
MCGALRPGAASSLPSAEKTGGGAMRKGITMNPAGSRSFSPWGFKTRVSLPVATSYSRTVGLA